MYELLLAVGHGHELLLGLDFTALFQGVIGGGGVVSLVAVTVHDGIHGVLVVFLGHFELFLNQDTELLEFFVGIASFLFHDFLWALLYKVINFFL